MIIVPVNRQTQQLSRLFDDTFDRFFGSAPLADTSSGSARSPALDVAETDRAYTVKLDLPGVAKQDVKVAVEGRQVSVRAHSQQEEEKKDGERVIYRERATASYERSFSLPLEVDLAEAHARLEDGVLTLTLPKRSARAAAQITVN